MRVAAAALLLLLCLPAPLPARAQAAPSQPSVLLIVTDDQRWDTLGTVHGVDGVVPVMPTIESLASQGIRFTDAHVNTPLCGPSRAAILTGQYGHTSGMRTGSLPWGGAQVFDDSATVATWLDAAGYRTGLYGFYLFEYGPLWPAVPPGWDEWHVYASGGAYDFTLLENGAGFDHVSTFYPSGCADYDACPGDLGGCENPVNHQNQVLRDKVIDFLDSQPADEPFFLTLMLGAPHLPACAEPQDVGGFDGLEPWRPPSYDEPQTAGWNERFCPLSPNRAAYIDGVRRQQLESLQGVDRAVAAITDKLAAMGRADDTVLIFTSDNGFRWGEHCSLGKPCPHEECTRVPLVVRWPEGIAEPRSVSWPVRLVDLAPTLVELGGATATIPMDGQSLVPLFSGGAGPSPPEVLSEWWRKPHLESQAWQPPNNAALRAYGWKFVQYDTGERELFHLAVDPFEINDLSGDPQYALLEEGFRARIHALGHRFGCEDGIDTDGDGLTDLDDPGCVDSADLAETEQGRPCDDGRDNDGDGFYDSLDAGCADPLSPRENPQCNDGIDNDRDGFIDGDGGAAVNGGKLLAAPDPTCGGDTAGATEGGGPPACGLGVELVLLAPLLGRRRRTPA